MAVGGLIALLDDIAAIADDVATLTAAAAKKTSGIVTDDLAVTAENAIGIRREREIPVVLAVARGSAINKGLILAPGALLLNAVAPWAITPLLMCGGAFLCFEGVEKIMHRFFPHHDDAAEAEADPIDSPEEFEKSRIQGAIRTDLILSAEIVAISLGEIKSAPFMTQVVSLYAICAVMTVGVYGLVAALVKMDDLGEWLALKGGPRAGLGRMIVAAAPKILHAISVIGTVAMLMVGGHIIQHGIPPLEHLVHGLVEKLPHALHGVGGMGTDIVVGGIAGLILVGVFATGIPTKIGKAIRGLFPKKTK